MSSSEASEKLPHTDDRWVESATGSPHDTKTLSDSQREFLGAPRHLLARPHPVTGETALYCPCATSRGIEGMGDDEARALLTELTDHALSREYRYDHQHHLGDLVIWDNAATLHKATPLPPAATEEDVRVMFRVTLKGRPTVLS